MKATTYQFTVIVLFLLFACSTSKQMNEVINNNDPEEGPRQRYELANKYYDEGDFYKAIQLYEIVIQENIMVNDLAEVYYRYAFSHFAQGDFITASNLFNNFYQSYPDNKNAETAYFYRAVSNYELAEPDFRLDQSTMIVAMKEFQDYLITYPNGEYADTTQIIITNIAETNQEKELSVGKLYYKIEEYKAAIQEFNRFIEENPSSSFVEDAYFEILKSEYQLAKHSISSLKKERLEKVLDDYEYFKEKYNYGRYAKEAREINQNAIKELEKLDNEES